MPPQCGHNLAVSWKKWQAPAKVATLRYYSWLMVFAAIICTLMMLPHRKAQSRLFHADNFSVGGKKITGETK